MPVLELEEIGIKAERKHIDFPEEERKPVICVFDPNTVHSVIFDHALAGLRDRVDIFWQVSFSQTWIEVGGVDEWTHFGLIAVKRPILLISELEVIPGEGYKWGIEILQNLRRARCLEDTPLIVISNADCLLKVLGETESTLAKLKINQFFTWTDLEKEPREQQRLFDFVSQILAPESELRKTPRA